MAIYTVWKAKRKGKVHGRNWKWSFWPFFKAKKPVIPSSDQIDVTHYEKSIIQAAEHDMARIQEDYFRKDNKLKRTYCSLMAIKRELEKREPKESEEAQEAKEKFQEAQNKLAELGQPVIKDWVVKLILFLFIATEFPLNALVFSIFGEGRLMTYFMAGVIGFGIPLGAHYVGKVIRQTHKERKDNVLASVVTIIIIGVIIGIAVLRADYLSYVLSAYNVDIDISPKTAAIIFVGINLFLFFLAGFVSYLGTHKNNEEYQKLKGQMEIARARWEKETKESVEITKQLIKIEARLAKIRAQRECLHNQYRFKAAKLKESAENLIEIYRNSNIENRPDESSPPCFNEKLKVAVPSKMKEPIDWRCD